MKIALDFAFSFAGGVIPYFKDMVRLLPEIDQKNEYLLLITDKGYKIIRDFLLPANIRYKILPRLENNFIRLIWEQTVLPFILRKEKVDVVYCVNNRAPLISFKFKKVILLGTIGPFIEEFILHFGFLARMKYRILAKLIVLCLNRADMTIFESFYTHKLLKEKYGFKGHGKVNYHGRPAFKREDYSEKHIKSIRQKFSLENEYFLYITYVKKYKNIERLIEAFAYIQSDLQQTVDFVVAGPWASQNYYIELRKLCSSFGVKETFRFIGMVNYEELAPLSLGCLGYVFPSKYENLSYALVEALTYGLPIITTTGTAMPETCGDAAFYFDPEDTEGLADAMARLVNDEDLRERLRNNSLKRARLFRDMKEDIFYNFDIFNEIVTIPTPKT